MGLTGARAGRWTRDERKRPPGLLTVIVLPALAVAAAIVVAVATGGSSVDWRDLVEVAGGGGDPATRQILLGIRLPRVLLAGLVGAALAGAGGAFQAVLRNPLADPYILGVSGGAAAGAVVFVSLAGATGGSTVARPLAAFAGAIGSLVVLFRLARVRGRTGTASLLLAGVVLNALYSSAILLLVATGDPGRLQWALSFLVGSIPSPARAAATVGWTGLLVGLGLAALLLSAHRLNLLSLGEESAGQLGVDTERAIWQVVAAASLATAAAVSVAGLVGFVGLITPHAVRALYGPDHRRLLPAAALIGAAFLILADLAARTAAYPKELPVGVVTTLVGGPLFLVLLHRRLRAEG